MEKIKKFLGSLSETVSFTKMDGLLMLIASALAGCVIGMLLSPRKTISCGNGNGCSYTYEPDEEEDEEVCE